MTFFSKFSIAIGLSLATAAVGAAQCPDGTPPPCDSRRAAPLAAIPKRVNPPLNDKAWIVLPFNNVTHAADTEWLSDASVNLLSMDLSRWQDVSVIDDRRVADFMRELARPANAKLSFNDGVTVARRAGAGRLVIGDILKVGSKTTVSATVFNVRDGKQIRAVREETAVADSIMPLFGKLARGLLAVPTADANVGSVGTARVDAYKEYVAGIQALNRFDATAAKKSFDAALKLDPGFALAHYKWAMAANTDEQAMQARAAQLKVNDANALHKLSEDTARDRHAAAAARLSAGLPPRDRKLIAGLQAMSNHDYPTACAAYGSLVAADSSDVEALYGYGVCLVSDDMVVAVNGDTTKLRFRSSWNTAIKAFRRALVVDPTFHLAFDPVVRALTLPARIGCRHPEVVVVCADTTSQARYTSAMTRSGDSLVQVPVAMGSDAGAIDQMMQMLRGVPRRENIEAARAVASEWASASAGEGRAHRYLAALLLRLGKPAEAEVQLKEAMLDPALRRDNETLRQRLEIALKLGRGEETNALIDSTKLSIPGDLGVATFGTLAQMTGRMRTIDSIYSVLLKPQGIPPAMLELILDVPRIAMGMATDSLAGLERVRYAMRKGGLAECDAGCLNLMGASYMFALRIPRAWPKFLPGVDTSRRMAPAIALAKNDQAALRAAATMLDSASRQIAQTGVSEDGTSLIAAEAYLMLAGATRGDSVAALAAVRRMMDETLMATPIDGPIGVGAVTAGLLWPRALLLRADLEASAPGGNKDVAKRLYGEFLALWSRADPEFAPLIVRVKAAQAKLGA